MRIISLLTRLSLAVHVLHAKTSAWLEHDRNDVDTVPAVGQLETVGSRQATKIHVMHSIYHISCEIRTSAVPPIVQFMHGCVEVVLEDVYEILLAGSVKRNEGLTRMLSRNAVELVETIFIACGLHTGDRELDTTLKAKGFQILRQLRECFA